MEIKVKNFLSLFFRRQGHYVFSSMIIEKFVRFLGSILIVRLLEKADYGSVSFIIAIISSLIPFSGMGASHSLLRFGPTLKSEDEKLNLYYYSIVRGTMFSLFIILILLLFNNLITINFPEAKIFLVILSFQVLFSHLNTVFKNYLRVIKRNKLYSLVGVTTSISLFVSNVTAAYFFSVVGFAISITVVPFFVYLFYSYKMKISPLKGIRETLRTIGPNGFWKYGFYVGIGAVSSQLLFSMDIIFLGFMVGSDEKIALYKVATVIPYNLFFIPASFLTTDFVVLAENYKNKKFLIDYIKNYSTVFLFVTLAIAGALIIFSKSIIHLLYGDRYIESYKILNVFIIGLLGTFLVRTLFGNILAAVGKAQWNVANAFVCLSLNAGLNYFLIAKYQMFGAAYATVIVMWVSGLIGATLFYKYINGLDNE